MVFRLIGIGLSLFSQRQRKERKYGLLRKKVG